MTDDVSLEPLLSIRTWEFDTDEIRLSAMSNARFVEHIQEVFHFDRAAIDRPAHRDRGKRAVWPPGLIFELGVGPVEMGAGEGDDVEEVAFRKLTIEADRISIEVAGKTAYADELMAYIRLLLSEIHTPEGHPFIGEPATVSDFSIVVMRNAARLAPAVLSPAFSDAVTAFANEGGGISVLPEVSIRFQTDSRRVALNSRPQWTLKPRFGTQVSRGIFESQAELASDEHLALLRKLIRNLDA